MNLAAMQAGREAQLQREREAQRRQHTAYMQWVKAESAAYRRYRHAAALGEDISRADWLAVVKAMPTPPPDHAECWRS